jgi:hypothetical protein
MSWDLSLLYIPADGNTHYVDKMIEQLKDEHRGYDFVIDSIKFNDGRIEVAFRPVKAQ